MKVTDPIANLLSSLSNGAKAGKKQVIVPASAYKERLLEILKNEGIIADFKRQSQDGLMDTIEVTISQSFSNFKRLSKPGRRLYVKSSQLRHSNRKTVIVSTPKGVMTANKAIKNNLGGEIILEVS